MENTTLSFLSETQLEAFYVISNEGSLTRASERLHISQPALSRRLKGLEETLELTLFDRTPQGVELTEAGQKLLLYVKNKMGLEQDFINDLKTLDKKHLTGLIRVAGHSSIIEPVAMPALSSFLRENPAVQVEFSVKPNSELDEMLNYAKTDLILSNNEGLRKDVIQHELGEEEFICIESATSNTRSNVYLDSNHHDRTTEAFFEIQSNPPAKYSRSFMHDENGILTGVQLGIGRAIKPKQTLKRMDGLKLVRGFRPLRKPVYLRYSKKQFYTKLEIAVIEILKKEIPRGLKV